MLYSPVFCWKCYDYHTLVYTSILTHMLYQQYFAENADWYILFYVSIKYICIWLVYTDIYIHIHDVSPGMICFSLFSLRVRSDFRYSPQLQHKEMLDVCNKLPLWVTHHPSSTGYSTPGTTQVWEFNPQSLAQWVLSPKSKRFYCLYRSLPVVHWNPNSAEYTNTFKYFGGMSLK